MGPTICLFGLLGMSSPGFKGRAGRLFTPYRGACDARSPRFTSGVTPTNLLVASMAAGHFSSHAYFNRGYFPHSNPTD